MKLVLTEDDGMVIDHWQLDDIEFGVFECISQCSDVDRATKDKILKALEAADDV